MLYSPRTHDPEDRRATHGIGRGDVAPADHEPGRVSGPQRNGRVRLAASGDVRLDVADELVTALHALDPNAPPFLTLDLTQATALDPIVIHALMHAWEQRGRQWGCIRILVQPGPVQQYPVQQYLDLLNLGRAFDIIHPGELKDSSRQLDPQKVRQALSESIDHYRYVSSSSGETISRHLRKRSARRTRSAWQPGLLPAVRRSEGGARTARCATTTAVASRWSSRSFAQPGWETGLPLAP